MIWVRTLSPSVIGPKGLSQVSLRITLCIMPTTPASKVAIYKCVTLILLAPYVCAVGGVNSHVSSFACWFCWPRCCSWAQWGWWRRCRRRLPELKTELRLYSTGKLLINSPWRQGLGCLEKKNIRCCQYCMDSGDSWWSSGNQTHKGGEPLNNAVRC